MSAKTKMYVGVIYDANNDAELQKAPQDNGLQNFCNQMRSVV